MQQASIVVFGEVLVDNFPDGTQVLGGAPFNVAWHLQAFQQTPLFISRVGVDAVGNKIRAAMRQWGLTEIGLQSDSHYPSGQVSIQLQNGEPNYSILDFQAYDFINAAELPVQHASWVYHGSLALRHLGSQQALQALKQDFSGLVFMDVNLRSPWWDKTVLEKQFITADWLKLNQHELHMLKSAQLDEKTLMQQLIDEYQLAGVVLTCSEAGAMALAATGEFLQVKPESNVQVLDTVGAGDAFAAVFLLGLQLNWSLAVVMQRAQDFATAIVGQRGAIVTDLAFYEVYVGAWLEKAE
jgi:fructokinase